LAKRTGALMIPQQHLDKHIRRFADAFEPINAQLLFTLRALAQRINDNATESLSPLGLTARKYNYLSVIYVEGKVTPNDISTLIHTANPTVTSMLNALERDGLITRSVHPDDKRSFVVQLTPKGKSLYERAFKLNHANIDRSLAKLSMEERRQLFALLLKLADAISDGKKNGGKKR
jgi:DNA-binding MarR family transcriptional regulator